MRYFVDCLRMIRKSLRETRLRFFLTILGISFGTAALIAVLSIGQGGVERVDLELSDIGIKRVWLYAEGADRNYFDQEDLETLAAQMGEMASISPVSERFVYLNNTFKRATSIVMGCNELLPVMESITVKQGRFFSQFDCINEQDVAVIEERLAEKLYSHTDVLGNMIDIDDHQAVIIGVFSKRNTRTGDGMIYIPINTYQKWYDTDALDYISLSVDQIDELPAVEYLSREILVSSTGDTVTSSTLEGEQELVNEVMSIFKWVIGSVAVVALLVGGIGIMNVMYMSVQARIREIGIRKAIGAKDSQILIHFMIESVALSVTGGIIGMAFGSVMAYAASIFANIPFTLPLYAFIISTSFSLCVGIVFGIAPAMRAASIPPVRAFKNE